MNVRPRRVLKYVAPNGKCPFDVWFNRLKEKRVQAIVATRINRLIQGNFGLCRKLGPRFWELKINVGPGYRVYFGEEGKTLVVLLAGGDKSTQKKDIERANKYWQDYKKES